MVHRIDAHQHFWDPGRGDYGWLRADDPSVAALYREFLPAHLEPILTAAEVERTVLVQAAPSEAETEFMLGLAGRHAFIGAVVGWVDVSRASSANTVERWSEYPKFRGVRPMLQDLPDDDWIAHAPDSAVIDTLVRRRVGFDALVRPRQLPGLVRFVDAHPEISVVIDHAAKPQLAEGWSSGWAATWDRCMQALARHPQVVCKFSGLLTEAPLAARQSLRAGIDAVRPVWDALLRWFGPARLMWGSDWPVVTLACDYARWLAVADALVGELSAAERDRVWHGTAREYYRLDGWVS